MKRQAYKPMIICEIGINHLGDVDYADHYLSELLKVRPDGITFLVRERAYNLNTKDRFILPDEYYIRASRRIKKVGIRFGIVLADIDKAPFFKKLGVDFYKVISRDVKNKEIIKALMFTGKPLYFSTGMSDESEISSIMESVKSYRKNITLIQTQLDHDLVKTNLKAIAVIRERFKVATAFGLHTADHEVIKVALGLEPSALFFYIRGSRPVTHPDHEHAIKLSECRKLVDRLRILAQAVGSGRKEKMEDIINLSRNRK